MGIENRKIKSKNSPVLVETLSKDSSIAGVLSVSCGSYHNVINTLTGWVYSWGEGIYGALGL